MSKAFDVVKSTFRDFFDDRCPQMAAALSYYTVFSLPPLLLLLLAIAGIFVDAEDLRGRIVSEMHGLLGAEGAQLIREVIAQTDRPGRGAMAVVGTIALLLGATGAFGQLQQALNSAWEVKPDPKQGGVRAFIAKRVVSFGMVLVIAFLLLVSFAISALVAALGDALGQILQVAIGFAITWGLFTAIFKIMPDAEIAWRDVRLGAFVTAILFTVGRFVIGLYLGQSSSTSAFGAAAALAVLLVWIYYAAIILLLGAEFTQVWARSQGRSIEPEPGAIRIPETARTHARS